MIHMLCSFSVMVMGSSYSRGAGGLVMYAQVNVTNVGHFAALLVHQRLWNGTSEALVFNKHGFVSIAPHPVLTKCFCPSK